VPAATVADYTALEMGGLTNISAKTGAAVAGNPTVISNNAFIDTNNFNTGWKRLIEAACSQHLMVDGTHKLRVAGTAVTTGAITWTDALTIDSAGAVSIPGTLGVTGTSTLGSVKSYNDISLTNSAGGAIESWIWTNDAASTMKIGVGPISSANAKLAITATGLAVTGTVSASGNTTLGPATGTASPTLTVQSGDSGVGISTVNLGTRTRDWQLSSGAAPYSLKLRYNGTDTGPFDLLNFTTGGALAVTGAVSATTLSTFSAGIAFKSAATGTGVTNTGLTLSDYETGDWTPSVGGDATYTTQVGTYTKIGDVVTVCCKLVINVIGTGSASLISGLPFTASSAALQYIGGSMAGFSGLAIAKTTVMPFTMQSSPSIYFQTTAAAVTTATNVSAIMGSGTNLMFTITFKA
jgi:hypothetical protein